MEILIRAKPVFDIPFTLYQVQAISMMSEGHYDRVCRAASEPGGFVYGWVNALSAPSPLDGVTATWHELDIVSKIMEHTEHLPEKMRQELGALRKALGSAMHAGRQQVSNWSYKHVTK